jgi:hypothetical protein
MNSGKFSENLNSCLKKNFQQCLGSMELFTLACQKQSFHPVKEKRRVRKPHWLISVTYFCFGAMTALGRR